MKSNLTVSGLKNATIGEEIFSRSVYNYKESTNETFEETLESIKLEIIAHLDKIKQEYDDNQIMPQNIDIKVSLSV